MTDQADPDLWLRVDTGTHSSSINELVGAPNTNCFYSIGSDKRIRRWQPGETRPINSYVGRLGLGDDGDIRAVALHPDEHVLVAAVHSPIDSDEHGDSVLRVIDVDGANGVMRTFRWGSTVADLSFDRTGEFVVVATAERLELHRSITITAADAPFVDRAPPPLATADLADTPTRIVVGVSGRGQTRIFTISSRGDTPSIFDFDGETLTEAAFLDWAETPPGRPRELAIGQDLLAVAYDSAVAVFDLDGGLLQIVADAGAGAPARMAFSMDARLLVVGSQAGRGSEVTVHDVDREFAVVGARRYDADALAVALVGSADPKVVSAGGSRFSIHLWSPETVEPSEYDDFFIDGAGQLFDAVGIHGNEVGFGHPDPVLSAGDLDGGNGDRVLARRFDLSQLALGSTGTSADDVVPLQSFVRARATHGGQRLEVSRHDRNLILEPSGTAITGHGQFVLDYAASFGFLPSGRVAVGGQSGVVRTLRPDGDRLLGRKLIGHVGQVLDLAADDRWLVTAGRDQVIRLWNLAEAEIESDDPDSDRDALHPALNLFVTAQNEWVVWSRSGFYAASPKGDNHMTFHLNRGDENLAHSYAGDRFVKLLYRPEIIRKIFELGSEERALKTLGVEPVDIRSVLPPIVELLSPSTEEVDGFEFDLRFSVTESESPTTRIWILINGLPVWETEPPAGRGGTQYYNERLWIDEGVNRVRVLAENAVSKATAVEVNVYGLSEPSVVAAADWSDAEDSGVEIIDHPMDELDSVVVAVESDWGIPLISEELIDAPHVQASQTTAATSMSGVAAGFVWRVSKPDDGVGATVSATRNEREVWRAETEPGISFDLALAVPLVTGENRLIVQATSAIGVDLLGTATVQLGIDGDPGSAIGPGSVIGPGSAIGPGVDVDGGTDDEPTEVWHRVVAGQSLGTIARHYYGDATRYLEIFEANRLTLDDPDRIFVDQLLVIPGLPSSGPIAGQPNPISGQPEPPPAPPPVTGTNDGEVKSAPGARSSGPGIGVLTIADHEDREPTEIVGDEPPPTDDPPPARDAGPLISGGVGKESAEAEPLEMTRRKGDSASGTMQPAGPGRPAVTARPTAVPPNLYILSVGVSDLANDGYQLSDLRYADDDAKAVASRFAASEGKVFGQVWKQVLTDSQATKAGIEQGLADLKAVIQERSAEKRRQNTRAKDVTLLFFSGHGITRRGSGGDEDNFYLVPHDFDPNNSIGTAVPLIDVGEVLAGLPTELLIFVDACRSGGAGPDFVKRIQPEELAKRLHAISERTQYVLSSTSHDEDSWEHTLLVPYRWRPGVTRQRVGHGFFTHAILKKLDEAEDSVALMELLGAVQRQLKSWTERDGWRHIRQRPMYRIYGDIPHLEIYRK